MGQKVHPIGLRLGITKMWDSRWLFPEKKLYRECFVEDVKIRQGIISKFDFAHVTQVEIERAINKITVIIHAVKPGMIIGRGGKGLEDVKKFIIDTIGQKRVEKDRIKTEFKIEPVKKPYQNARYVAAEIAQRLTRSMPHRRVVHMTMTKIMESGAIGVKIQLSGRINGATIGRTEKYSLGKVSVSTIREDIDFAKVPSLTRSGYIGVKVWIARAE